MRNSGIEPQTERVIELSFFGEVLMFDSELKVETQLDIAKPMPAVFEAIVDPKQMSCYFITSGSGRLDAGEPVTWTWVDQDAQCTVTPVDIEPHHKIVFLWGVSGKESRVVIDLESDKEDGTVVHIRDGSWPADSDGYSRCMEQTQGWMHMLCCLKAYLEFGINLRAGTRC